MAVRRPSPPAKPAGKPVRRSRGRPRRAEGALLSQDALLDAALEAFAEQGYEAMSVRELTRRLGVSHNLVHHYYRSKLELWRAAVDRSFGTVAAGVREILEGDLRKADRDIIATWRDVYVRFLVLTARFPANLGIVLREGSRPGPRLDYIFERFVAGSLAPWHELLARAQAEGRVRPDVDVRTLFFLLTNGGASLFTLVPFAKKIGGPDPRRPDVIRAYAELVADVLLHGIVADARAR
jgi:TetR/AcrR family transcriptional regulator